MATLCSFCAANYVMRTRNAQAIKGEKNTFDEHEMKEISVYISFALWSYHTSILLFRFRNFQHTLHNHTHLTYIHTYTHTQNVCITHGLHITNESSVLLDEYDFILCFIVPGWRCCSHIKFVNVYDNTSSTYNVIL